MKSFLFLFILTYSFSFSQKKTEQIITIDASLSYLVLSLDNVFNIKLSSTTNNKLKIKTISEGEYANYFILSNKQVNNILHISGEIGFTFPNNQDKLSAHKVHAINVEFLIPEYLHTSVSSDIGNIDIEGDFHRLSTNSQSGNCYLNNVFGDFIIKTINGDISLNTNKRLINTNTKIGTISEGVLTDGKSNFLLKTAKGNINIVKSE